MRVVSIAIAVSLLLTCGITSAGAQDTGGARWRDDFRRAAPVDAVVIGSAGLLYLTDHWLIPRREEALWDGPILWDAPIRDALRVDVRGERETAAEVSDYLFTGSIVHNMIFDNLVVALALHGEPDMAFQMSVANLEAYAIAGALTTWIKTAAGRARPFARECERDPTYSGLCGAPTSYRAFFSAHAATTAVGAGLLCAHHLHLPLYDGGVLDVGSCAVGIALTLTTGALRVASDNHWSTDVTVGHLVGFASGYLVPTLLFYEWNAGELGDELAEDRGPRRRAFALLPMLSPDTFGALLYASL